MQSGPSSSATQCLVAFAGGNRAAGDRLFELLYTEMRALAARALRREKRDHTLQPTALVNEAYLRLIQGEGVDCRDRSHFLGVAARVIRRLLVEHARRRAAHKRGGAQRGRVTLVTALEPAAEQPVDLLALDEAIARLAQRSERQASVVELRFFGGLSVEETASVLLVSERTVKNDWRIARAWLRAALDDADGTA
jgi:RNA polymerase sigma factor (TIGR02999 family)